jgi:succinate-semialdehyde dehydrogenase / glutarate-semialdehyde dehydrogenase
LSPITESRVLAAVPRALFVGGEWVLPAAKGDLPVEDPATEDEIARVPDCGTDDALMALDAACQAQTGWAASRPNERAEVLWRTFEELRARAEELALLMTLEMGKPLADAIAEVNYAADFFRWFSGEALRLEGGYKQAGDGGSRVLVMRQPVGPSLLITPWNFPLAMGARKIAPAIAAGCTMVLKPARQTPLSSLALADVLRRCRLPDGVLNVITTSRSGPVVKELISDPRLRKLSFTGSTEVGRELIALSSKRILNVSMELGGNAPFLVFDDADLDAAVDGAIVAKMRNMGEACTAANRFLVARSLADEFASRLAGRMRALRVGRGTDPGVQVGPLIDQSQRAKVGQLVNEAIASGAHPILGGKPISGRGYFYQPTVLAQVAGDARLLREEIFGPVAPVTSFESEEEAIGTANETPYGLAAYVYTRDLARAIRASERLEAGMVGLNRGLVSNAGAPFGGVKQSGIGREGGSVGVDEFLETKYVAMADPALA